MIPGAAEKIHWAKPLPTLFYVAQMRWCNIGKYVGFHWSNYEDSTELKSPVGGLFFWRVVGQKTVLQRLFSPSVVSSVILGVASQSSPSNPKCSSLRHKPNEHQWIYRQERQCINWRQYSVAQRESATIHRSQGSKVWTFSAYFSSCSPSWKVHNRE